MIEAELSGQAVALPEAGTKILIVESHTFFFSKLLSQVLQQSVLLIRTDKQGRCKSFESVFLSNLGGFFQPQPVTIGAAVALMTYYSLKVFEHIVAFSYDEGQICRLSEGLHSLQAELVLSKGVNVGVVPEGGDLQPFILQGFHHVGRAGTAANVKKDGRHDFALATSSLVTKGWVGLAYLYWDRSIPDVHRRNGRLPDPAVCVPENSIAGDRARRHP